MLPRIRDFKDMVFHRPAAGVRYAHIDTLFGDPVNWRLIEDHWQDLMRVVISIRYSALTAIDDFYTRLGLGRATIDRDELPPLHPVR